MSKPMIGGGKATLPSAIIKPGKYKPKKFQMDMPDEKQSGIYGLKSGNNDEDDLVESLALDDNTNKRVSGSGMKGLPPQSLSSLAGGPKLVVQPKLLGPNMMRQKIKENLEDRQANPGKRPPSTL